MTVNKRRNLSIGLYEKALPGSMSWQERLICAKDAGYNFMEISIDETDERISRLKWSNDEKIKLRNLSEKIGLPFITMCLSGNRRFPIGSAYSDIRRKGVEMIIDAISFASKVGIRIVQLAGYDVISGEKSTADSSQMFASNLKHCVKYASAAGVMLAIENVDCDFGDSLDKLMVYVNDISSPWLQLYPDFGNLTAMGQDANSELLAYCSHITAIHVKDTREKVVRNVAYGEGIVDFIGAFEILKKGGFNGPFLLEMWADKNKDNFEIIKSSRLWVLQRLEKVYFRR
ncbi:MAG: L-ribulose-5-phosphate 3-epimerase [Actinobacteria bacterium]|nr:L-ribulose-5-phosphate 3-epimerase [Actinomycetota bacterium]